MGKENNEVFYNRRRMPYMTKLSLKKFRVNESQDDDYVPRTQEEIKELADSIRRAANKLNNIRKACMELDPEFDGKLIDITRLKITDKTLDDLHDMIYDEQRMLDAYNAEIEDIEDDELDPDEFEDSDIFDAPEIEDEDEDDDNIFDNLGNMQEKPASKFRLQGKSSLPEYNPNDDTETLFFKTMQYFWMTRSESELIDDYAFYMNLKKEPGVDYFVIPIAVFSDRSIIFKVLSIDGEEQSHLEPTISVKDIDLEDDHTDFADLAEIFERETYR